MSAEMFSFFTLLSFALDWVTLRCCDVHWRHLLDHYAARRWVFGVGYVLPVAVSIVILVQQLATRGDVATGAQGVSESVRNAASARP